MSEDFNPETGEVLDTPHAAQPNQGKPVLRQQVSTGQEILSVLSAINRGRFIHDLEDNMKELVKAVCEHNKMGKLTVVFEARPDLRTGTMGITADIKATLPRKPAHASVFFPVAESGSLSRVDARQSTLLPGNDQL